MHKTKYRVAKGRDYMYKNLEVGIFKLGISKKEIANSISIGYNSLLAKLSGKQPFKLDEAFAIKELYFPESNLEELFATE